MDQKDWPSAGWRAWVGEYGWRFGGREVAGVEGEPSWTLT